MFVKLLDTEGFDEALQKEGKAIIVDFYADWCAPCKMIAPMLEEIAKENESILDVYKINIDENPEIAKKFSVMSIPTVISFKDGALYKKNIGAAPKEKFLDLIK